MHVALPDFLVDRSLGTKAVSAVLRDGGFVVRTIDDVFGERPVADVEWIRVASDEGWAVATKDDRIRRRQPSGRPSRPVLCESSV